MNTAVIVAAGQGTRMARTTEPSESASKSNKWHGHLAHELSTQPAKSALKAKPFIDLDGVPVIIRTLRQFDKAREIGSVILVLSQQAVADFLSLTNKYGIRKLTRVIAGGDSRGESVWRGLLAVRSDTAEVVAVHDGVRPFVTPEEIDVTVSRARDTGAAILATPCIDTIKEVEGNLVVGTCERVRAWRALTPQAFRYELLMRAYEKARADDFVGTDESQLVERLGAPVTVVEGNAQNIKITYSDDLRMAQLILQNMV
ncbi:MAG: 2-C-methyl-D-erythritol 4-phosphate cytidylyltransferase [Pyrinomonadaceae bacterium]